MSPVVTSSNFTTVTFSCDACKDHHSSFWRQRHPRLNSCWCSISVSVGSDITYTHHQKYGNFYSIFPTYFMLLTNRNSLIHGVENISLSSLENPLSGYDKHDSAEDITIYISLLLTLISVTPSWDAVEKVIKT